ncbi:MAG TPA: YccF domain-containing protein [Deinococcales bacterium]|nr:YccF domain-containing protein [Deinococcales bacterium]
MSLTREQQLASVEERERGAMLERLQREEEVLRAEMRARLASETRPVPAAPAAGPQPVVVINNVLTAAPQAWTLPLLFRILYFAFVGWWAGLTWAAVALVFCVTFVGLPVGILMFAALPKVFFLW